MTVVSTAEWETVPAAQRTALDRESDAELAAVRAEIATASKSLAELPAASPAPAPAPATTPAPAAAGTADPDARALNEHEHMRTAARARVETARSAMTAADRAWRQRRLEAVNTRIAVVAAQRELRRGQAIDRNMLGSDTYDTAPLRGQLAETQRTWYAAHTRAQQARAELDRAGAELAAAKEAYAQIMLRIPGRPDLEVARVAPPSPPPPPLVLSAWAINRSDIRRRRGLRRFLDEVATAPPRLRPASFKLSPLPPRPPTAIAAPTPPANAPAAAPTTSAAPTANATPAAAPTPVTSPTAAASATAPISAKANPTPAKPTPPAPKAWDAAELSGGPPIVGTAPPSAVASSTPAPSKAALARPVSPAPAKAVTPSPAAPAPAAKPIEPVGEPR